MADFRIERDSMGELKVPSEALYGATTQRAIDNFPISGLTMPREFIRALGLIKSAAAQANADLGHLAKNKAKAIRKAAERVAAGEFDRHFPIDVFQTGSGTSSNMNANEVIAHVATQAGTKVHQNDDVNNGQSSNDVIPTAIHVSAALTVSEKLLPSLEHLKKTLDKRAKELKNVAKTGRTHLMDAMPVRRSPRTSRVCRMRSSACASCRRAARRSAPASTRMRSSVRRFATSCARRPA
jgi:fumarate hydratase class II